MGLPYMSTWPIITQGLSMALFSPSLLTFKSSPMSVNSSSWISLKSFIVSLSLLIALCTNLTSFCVSYLNSVCSLHWRKSDISNMTVWLGSSFTVQWLLLIWYNLKLPAKYNRPVAYVLNFPFSIIKCPDFYWLTIVSGIQIPCKFQGFSRRPG